MNNTQTVDSGLVANRLLDKFALSEFERTKLEIVNEELYKRIQQLTSTNQQLEKENQELKNNKKEDK